MNQGSSLNECVCFFIWQFFFLKIFFHLTQLNCLIFLATLNEILLLVFKFFQKSFGKLPSKPLKWQLEK